MYKRGFADGQKKLAQRKKNADEAYKRGFKDA